MKSCRSLALIYVLISTHIFVVLSLDSLNVNAWQSLSDEVEQGDFPESAYLLDRRNAAIGFSGGGKSFALSLQYLSACQHMSDAITFR